MSIWSNRWPLVFAVAVLALFWLWIKVGGAISAFLGIISLAILLFQQFVTFRRRRLELEQTNCSFKPDVEIDENNIDPMIHHNDPAIQ